MNRKNFILLSVLGAGSMVIAGPGCRQRNQDLSRWISQPIFLSQICDTKTLAEIGKTYLSRSPAEAREDNLVDMLMKDHSGNLLPTSSDSTHIRQILVENIESEFKAGETMVLNGWVLSKTEARQCALYSLTHSES